MPPRPSLALLLVGTSLAGCARFRADAAFDAGSQAYRAENYGQALEDYARAAELDPGWPAAWFYLGSSHHALVRPGRDTPENARHLDEAIAAYRKALEQEGELPEGRVVRRQALRALVSIFAEGPRRDPEAAVDYAQQIASLDPSDGESRLLVARLYERLGRLDEAEAAYRRAASQDSAGMPECEALAGFLNRPLWNGETRFDGAVAVLAECAESATDAEAFYTLATLYWDKAYRDYRLGDAQKRAYADRGLAAVDRALEIRPDYREAIVYRGLLLRIEAGVSRNPTERARLLDEARTMQQRALELR